MASKRLLIDSISAGLEIESRRAELQILQSRRIQMSLSQQAAQMQINRQLARVQIDQSAAFADMGLASPLVMASNHSAASLQKGMDVIARIAEEGQMFLRVENGQNAVRAASMNRSSRNVSINIQPAPRHRPSINFDMGNLDISWEPYSLNMDWSWQEAEYNYVPYEVNISVNPYPEVNITVEDIPPIEFAVNDGTGRYLNEAV